MHRECTADLGLKNYIHHNIYLAEREIEMWNFHFVDLGES